MPHQPTDPPVEPLWRPAVAYGMAAACLLLGLAVGYLLRGSESPAVPAMAAPTVSANANPDPHMPSLDQMKQMADKKVAPLLEQLQKDPNNKDQLLRIAYFYRSAHQFKQAASYFNQALALDQKNVAIRTEMASCLYYDGDVDGALAQLDESLKQSPNDANALFNLGVVRWKGRKDAAGAIRVWQQLLAANPNLSKKPVVERMIAEARQQGNVP
jgi:cytochrome c-type biogenesis protein CcmH/NrfG